MPSNEKSNTQAEIVTDCDTSVQTKIIVDSVKKITLNVAFS